MAYQKVETNQNRFEGFFEYEEGNVIEGDVVNCVITGKTDNGKEKGLVGIRLCNPCRATLDDKEFVASPGQLIALSITAATRILIGTEGKRVRCTFNEFKKTQKGTYHDWTIEIDDGQG